MFEHKSVLLKECIDNLEIKQNGIYIDCTLGGAGHSKEILKLLDKNGVLIGIDQDSDAINEARNVLNSINGQGKFFICKSNFCNLENILSELEIKSVDGILMDLGVSSYQLDEGERGFSYNKEAKLDMRMDKESKLTAEEIVNKYSEFELKKIFFEYGEEKWSARIAKFIIEARAEKHIVTTFDLVDIIKKAIPASARRDGPHPAKRTFQAIRIEVNKELDVLKDTISKATSLLNIGGRLCVITFHSLEDRIVKQVFSHLSRKCNCPKELPICICKNSPKYKLITRKPIIPSELELNENNRSRSAKLRVIERI